MLFINKQEDLDEVCKIVELSDVMSIDTEFLRRDTYFPKLSIIQIKTNDCQIIIDSLSDLDLLPFKNLLLNDKILKIFHAPREDLFIFYNLFKILPKNIFDTQIAARICKLGDSLSYSDLCYEISGVHIDKTYQKADWIKRPIAPDMLNYAMQDVEYLENIYKILYETMKKDNLHTAYQNKISTLLDTKNYIINPKKILSRIKFQNHSEDFILRMEIFVTYREECAMQLDLPRQHFITDQELVKICQYLPVSQEDLNKLNFNNKYLNKPKHKNQLFDLCLGFNEI